MIGMIGGALLKGGGKAVGLGKKTKKGIDPKKFAGKMEQTKEAAGQPKGAIVPSPGGGIIKVVDIKVEKEPDIKVDSKDPVEGEAHKVYNKVVDIEKALAREGKAKRKRAKKQATKTKKQQRVAKESWLEKGAKKIGDAATGLAGKTGIGSLWDTLMQLLAVTFLGWMARYLPQILSFAAGVIDWVGKIGRFIAMLVTPVIKGVIWIAGAGAAVVNMLLGTDPEEAAQKNLLGSLADIQKKIPLMEAAFAAFMVFGIKGKIKKYRKPGDLPKKSPKIKTPADRKAEARNRLQNQKANKNLKKINDFRKNQTKKITNAVSKEVPPGVKKVASNVGNTAKNVTS